jgi:transposase
MRVEVLGNVERRPRWSQDDKMRIVEETLASGAKVSEVARRNGVSTSLVFTWRRQSRAAPLAPRFAAVPIAAAAEVANPPSMTAERERPVVAGRAG